MQPVKLICGMISADADLLRRARSLLQKRFGEIDLESDVWPFDQTDYYYEEMGKPLLRQFLSFQETMSPELTEIKHETDAIEARITDECAALDIKRPVNLDPGYIHPGKLVLATTKDAAHRIYIGGKMYAEVTLQYTEGAWQTKPWTYPDYHSPNYHSFFQQVRTRLLEQQRAAEAAE